MPVEIERKFMVTDDRWRADITGEYAMRQGYFETGSEATVRIRAYTERAVLTIKGPTVGISRAEFEYAIPLDDARGMLGMFCEQRQVQKVRHEVDFGGHLWEVDVFGGANEGLVVAEVEIDRPDEAVELPDWVGRELSGDPRYRNARLAVDPWDGAD